MNQLKTDVDLLNEINQELNVLKTSIDAKDENTEVLELDDDDDDDDVIVDIIENVEGIDDEFNDKDDDDDDNDELSSNKELRKEGRARRKELRTKMENDIKQLKKRLGKGPDFRKAKRARKKQFRKDLRGDRQTVRLNLRANRKNRRANRIADRKLNPNQRSGILGFFRKVIATAKNTLINIAVDNLNKIVAGLNDDHFAKPLILKVVAFLNGLKSSGLSNDSPLSAKMNENPEKVDQLVTKVKDAVNNVKIKGKTTLKDIFEKALKFLKDTKSPALQIVSTLLGIFIL